MDSPPAVRRRGHIGVGVKGGKRVRSQYLRFSMLVGFVSVVLIFPQLASARFRDSFGLYGGLYSPSEQSTDSIYGSGFLFGLQYKFALDPHSLPDMGLAVSMGVLQKKGDPYNDNTFTAAESLSRLTLVPVELSYVLNLISNRRDTGGRIRSLYAGIGTNYVWARERLPESPLAKGGTFGGQILGGVDFFISKHVTLGLEIKYLRNRPLMKSDEASDYRVRLDGTQVQVMLAWAGMKPLIRTPQTD